MEYADAVLHNFFDQFLRRGGRLLAHRGLEMAWQGRILAVMANYWSCRGGVGGGSGLKAGRETSSPLLDNADQMLGMVSILRERHNASLARWPDPGNPRHGTPTGNDEADLWYRTIGDPNGTSTELPYYSIAAEMYDDCPQPGRVYGVLCQLPPTVVLPPSVTLVPRSKVGL